MSPHVAEISRSAVIGAKLTPPSLPPGAIVRAPLASRLDGDGRVVVMVAPPGFGKTVAARQWASASSLPVAWLTVDLLDDHPSAFWTHLIAAMRTVLPEIDDEPELLLAERGAADPLFLLALLAQIERAERRVALVLDDLSHVSVSSAIDGVALLVERVGHLVRVVVTSRSDLALPVARWRSLGWVVEVREEQLRFADADVAMLARQFDGVDLDDDAVTSLTRRVAGWPIGIHLALVSVAANGDTAVDIDALVDSDRVLADYVVSEVLNRLPDAVRDAVLALSVVESFDLEFGRRLAGRGVATAVGEMIRLNLFVVEIGHSDTISFHRVFRELLERELRRRDPELHVQLHRRAAEAYRDRGDIGAAHRHFVRVGDVGAADELIVGPTLDLVNRGDHAGLAALMRGLPRHLPVEDPSVAIDIAIAWIFAGSVSDVAEWLHRAEALVDPTDVAVHRRLVAVHAAHAMMLGDLDAAHGYVATYDELAHDAAPRHPFEQRFATVASRVAIGLDRLDEAQTWVDRARADESSEIVTSVTVPALDGWLRVARGDLGAATTLADAAHGRAVARNLRPHHGTFEAMMVVAVCRAGAGDLVAAADLAESARADADQLRVPWSRVRAGILAAEIRRLSGHGTAALALVRDLRRAIGHAPAEFLRHELDHAEAATLVACDRLDAARPIVARLTGSPRARLLAARLAMRSGAPGRKAEVRALVGDQEGWTMPHHLEAEVLLASVEPASAAAPRLRAALGEARSTGWVSPFLGHPSTVTDRLVSLDLQRAHPALTTARRTGRATPPSPRSGEMEAFTERERTLLELLPTHLSYAQMGEQLYLSVNTVKTNLKSVYRKLGARSRSEAVELARRLGLA